MNVKAEDARLGEEVAVREAVNERFVDQSSANRRSLMFSICAAAIMMAAESVFDTRTGWPNVTVAAIVGGLGLSGGLSIVQWARGGLRHGRSTRLATGVAS